MTSEAQIKRRCADGSYEAGEIFSSAPGSITETTSLVQKTSTEAHSQLQIQLGL